MNIGEIFTAASGFTLGFLVAVSIAISVTTPNDVHERCVERVERYRGAYPDAGPIPASVDVETGEVTWRASGQEDQP